MNNVAARHHLLGRQLGVFCAGSMVLAIAVAVSAADPPKVDYLHPAGLQRGTSQTISAGGTFAEWPVQTWIDRAGISFEAAKEKGKFSVTAQADAKPGVYFVRCFTAAGASSLRPLIVGTLPDIEEKEPNDAPDNPQMLTASATVNGRLQKQGDVDTFGIELKTGQTVVASFEANRTLGSPVDSVLQICSADGFVLLQNDDARGFDSQIVYTAPRAGVYLIRAFGFPAAPNSSIAFAGAENYVYRLTITSGGFIDHTLPLSVSKNQASEVGLFGWNIPPASAKQNVQPAPGQTIGFRPELAGSVPLPMTEAANLVAKADSGPDQPQTIPIPSVVSGRIERSRDVDTFAFAGTKGKQLSFRIESRALGFPLDPQLSVTDSEGKVLAEVDDTGRESRDATLAFKPSADVQYFLNVRDLHGRGGLRFVYRLTVEESRPDFALTLAAGEFTLTSGTPLEIPVTVVRANNFAGEIEITAEGLPEGVSVEPAKSLAKGDTAKTVKLKLTAAGANVSGPIRILGRAESLPPHIATFTIAGTTHKHQAAWLTVVPAK